MKRASRKRSLMKTLTWRVASTVLTVSVVWFVSGTISTGLIVGLLDITIVTALYYGHERVWDMFEYGLNKDK